MEPEQAESSRQADPSPAPGPITRLLADIARTRDVGTVPPPRTGDRLGRFLLVRPIGRGGFGLVFEAEDTELRRRVAIKVIRPERGTSPSREEWIRREAEAAARVHHPSVVTLHDAGHWEGGTYLVYELLAGETLAERLERDHLTRDAARRILRSVAEGLATMHANGVIHRDLTPDNVFLEESGGVKILDLGIAQVAGAVGLRAGSPPYVAPEQWRGDETDARADVFSWGMLAQRIRSGRAPEPAAGESQAPRGSFRALVDACRSPDRRRRPADGSALVAELGRIDRRRRMASVVAGAVVGLALFAAFYGLGQALKHGPRAPSGPFRVAVADAENRSGRPSMDGLGDLVSRGLQGVSGLHVLDRPRLVGVLHASGRATPEQLDRGLARFAARRAGGSTVLVPTVSSLDDGFVLGVEALEPESGRVVFSVREEVPSEDAALDAVKRLVRRLLAALREREPEVRGADLEISRAVSSSMEAHRHYLDGLRCVDRPTGAGVAGPAACEQHFRRALAIDPDFPLANFELVRLMYWNEYSPEELRAALGPTLRSLDRLPAREQALVRAWATTLSSAPGQDVELLQAAALEFPEDAGIAFSLGETLSRLGRQRDAVSHFQRAFDLDPGFEAAAANLVWTLGRLDRTDELRRLANRLSVAPPSPGLLAAEAAALGFTGDVTGALAVARRAAPGGSGPARERLEDALVAAGQWDEVESMLRVDAERDPASAPDRLGRFLLLRGRDREASAVIDPRSTSAEPRLRFIHDMRMVHQVHDARKDLDAVRRIAAETARWSKPHAARFAVDLAYLGDAEGAGALADASGRLPGAASLVGALVAWRTQGAPVALPALRRLARGDPESPDLGPPESIAWFAAECAVDAGPDPTALEDLRAFQRFYFPLGQFRVWAYPRSLLLEALVLDGAGKHAEALAPLARLEDLLAQADPGHPVRARAIALRRHLGAGDRLAAPASHSGRREPAAPGR